MKTNKIHKEIPTFFESLHRPFHQHLKTSRWVCEFIASNKYSVKSSELNLEFYFYLLNKLNKAYLIDSSLDLPGISSRNAINTICNYLAGQSKKDKALIISSALSNSTRSDIEKQIYSTYKSASYYVNLAKDKLELISNKNDLTNLGLELLSIRTRSHLTLLSTKEQIFYFRLLIKNDFLLFISKCLFKNIELRYNLSEIEQLYFNFVYKTYGIKHFNYTNKSLSNYNIVRESWINQIGVLTKNNQIKSKYLVILKEDIKIYNWFEDLSTNFNNYLKQNFKNDRSFESQKLDFIDSYKKNLLENKDVQGFVNLYDIKSNIRISHSKFNDFLNKFYEHEKVQRHIFFSNIVSSIDRRERFIVRERPVLKIKFKTK